MQRFDELARQAAPGPGTDGVEAAGHRLSIEALACGRGERALFSGFHQELASGEIVRVLGDNGAGKTTLLRTLAGLLRPLAGSVRWQRDSAGPADIRESLCFIDHDNALNATLTPLENLALLCRLSGGGAMSPGRIRAVLSGLGLERLRHRPCGRLSSGQKRRVALARLWLSTAPLWLLDEPAAALDADSRIVLADRIIEHAAAGGIVVYTTHEPLNLPMAREIVLTSC